MRILYFISVHGHGRGGHFHSLNHISQKVGKKHEVRIISFGPGKSNIIESNPHFLKHITFNGLNFIKLKHEIKTIVQEFNPSVYHCFDEGSYNIIRLIISSKKHDIVLNKCGGPNPKYFPHIDNLILFSVENLDWFSKQTKYQKTSIHLIPNRVKALIPNETFHPIKKDSSEFAFMRICRIGKTYEKSISDSIQMIEYLFNNGVQHLKLYIVGTVEDADLFKTIALHPLVKNKSVIFLTESTFTSEASRMLYLADAVIGTGRGLMEAASLSLPILTINTEGNIPVLLNSHNFQDAFKTNFSERNNFDAYIQNENLESITKLVQNTRFYTQMSQFAKKVFDQFFNLDAVVKAYPDAYEQAIRGERKLFKDASFIIRSLYNFYRNYLKTKTK